MTLEILTTAVVSSLLTTWFLRHRHQQSLARQYSRSEKQIADLRSQLDLHDSHYQNILNTLDAAFLIVHSNEEITYANQCAIEFFDHRPALDRPIHELFLEPQLTNCVTQCLLTQQPVKKLIVRKNHFHTDHPTSNTDQALWIDCAPFLLDPSQAPGARVILRDVTPTYQTEQIRKDFVANASHELRTPLSIINGYIENLLDDPADLDSTTTKHYLNVMLKHGLRLSNIIEDMLVISRLESPEASPLQVESFSLQSITKDVLERLESTILKQHATVTTHFSSDPILIWGDPFYWSQMLFNLVENALKQNTDRPLHITISGHINPDHSLTIKVEDDGIGIPKNDLPFIFHRFYRVQKHHSQQRIKGTGLGLSIVNRIVEAHHGSIRAASVPGVQTSFIIHLPNTAPATTPSPSEADSPRPA